MLNLDCFIRLDVGLSGWMLAYEVVCWLIRLQDVCLMGLDFNGAGFWGLDSNFLILMAVLIFNGSFNGSFNSDHKKNSTFNGSFNFWGYRQF